MSEKKSYPKEIQKLITMGKSKGYLTYEEVNDGLPDEILSPDDLDDVMDLFSEKEIQLVDTEAEFNPEEDEFDFHDDGSLRSPDPVKMYLHEMGSVSLLSREDETEIAKRIEAGQRQILNVIINSPVTVKEVIQIGQALENAEMRLKDVVDIDDIIDIDEEIYKNRTLEVIKAIEGKQADLKNLKYSLFKAKSNAQKEKIKTNMAKVSHEIVRLIHDIHFLPEQIDLFGSRLKELKRLLETNEDTIVVCEQRFCRSIDEIREVHQKVCDGDCDDDIEEFLKEHELNQADFTEIAEELFAILKDIKKIEIEGGLTAHGLKKAVRILEDAEQKTNAAKTELIQANLQARGEHCKEICQPWTPVPGPHSGREHRAHEGG